jgi:hypothetical protein
LLGGSLFIGVLVLCEKLGVLGENKQEEN